MVAAKNIEEQQDADLLCSSPEALLEQGKGGVANDLELSVEDQLALSQGSRVHAEAERQRVAKGIVDATREACQDLIADGEKVLKKAMRLEVEAGLRACVKSTDEASGGVFVALAKAGARMPPPC